MWSAISRWRQRRILSRTAIPDALWLEAAALRPFLAIYDADELSRLREKVVLFLHAKAIVGARGHEVTPLQRVVIAIEACVLVLELDMAFYDGFENVIVYPGEFVPDWEWEDEAGVVHRNDEPMAGEAMPGGPVVLSWPDVAASADWESTGMNLVIHEFAHKIDMRRGEADGCPPLPAGMSQDAWIEALTSAYEDFLRPGRSARIDGHRCLRGREPCRILCRALGGVFRGSASLPARVPAPLRAIRCVLPAGPGGPYSGSRVAFSPGRRTEPVEVFHGRRILTPDRRVHCHDRQRPPLRKRPRPHTFTREVPR
jgi:Mlc titration factor MtfA (ptsG expression regulator)